MSNTKKVVLGVTSATLTAIAAALLLATGALAWLYGTHGTSDGFLNTPGVTLTAEGYAVVSTDFDIDALPDEWWVRMDTTGTLRVAARAAGDSPVFIGVAPASEVVDYLDDVAHVVVTRVSSNDRASYEERSGSRPAPSSGCTISAKSPG